MPQVVPFTRTRRPPSQNSKQKSTCSSANWRKLSRNAKLPTVDAANVFQLLAIENRHGFQMLESLANEMLDATRRMSVAAAE